MDRLYDLLFVSSLKGVGKKTVYKKYLSAIKKSEDTEDLISNYIPRIKDFSSMDIETAKDSANTEIEEIHKNSDIEVITCFCEKYPNRLRALGNSAPLVLYVRGNSEILDQSSVAVVGTRRPSFHSVKVEQNLVSKIIDIKRDQTIISGLAIGCDEIAHRTTLQNNGITAAVLPSGVGNIVPAQNRHLAEEIVSSGGCLISEYSINSDATRWSFVERDGLIAALADTTLVVECGVNSGTMHTVNKAIELHKPVACYWPADFSKGSYDGNAYMIENMKAKPLRDTEELRKLIAT